MTPVPDRMLAKISVSGDCWLWTGAKNGEGYGVVRHERRTCLAHRVLYELVVGVIPEGTELDHLCHTRACVRPEHLEAVVHRVNVARGELSLLRPRKSSRHVGVCWNKGCRKWQAHIRIGGKLRHLGLFADEEAAAEAYRKAAAAA